MEADTTPTQYTQDPIRLLCFENNELLSMTKRNLMLLFDEKGNRIAQHYKTILIEIWIRRNRSKNWDHKELELVMFRGYTILKTENYVCVISRVHDRIKLNVAGMHHLYLENDRRFRKQCEKKEQETFLYLYEKLTEEKQDEKLIAQSFLCRQMPTGRWVKLDLAVSSSLQFNNMTFLSKLQRMNTLNILELLDFTKHYRSPFFKEFLTAPLGWLVTPYFISVNELISFNGRNDVSPTFDWKDVGGILRQTINGMEFMHRNSIVHMQLCSENVLCDTQLNIKIANFHYAKSLSALRKSATRKGGIKRFEGVPYLYPPELHLRCSAQQISTAVDIWELGMFAVELVFGKHPLQSFSRSRLLHTVMIWNQDYLNTSYQVIASYFPHFQLNEGKGFESFLGMTIHADPDKRATLETLQSCFLCDVESKQSPFCRQRTSNFAGRGKLLQFFDSLRRIDDIIDQNFIDKVLEYLLEKVQALLVTSNKRFTIDILAPGVDQIADWIGIAVGNIFKFCCFMGNSQLTREQENIQILLMRAAELCVHGVIIAGSVIKDGLAAFSASFTISSVIFLIYMLLRIAYRIFPKKYKHLAETYLESLPCFQKIMTFLRTKKETVFEQLRWFQLLVIAFARIRLDETTTAISFYLFPGFALAVQHYFDELIQLKHKLDLRHICSLQRVPSENVDSIKADMLDRIGQQLKEQTLNFPENIQCGSKDVIRSLAGSTNKISGIFDDINKNYSKEKKSICASPVYNHHVFETCSLLLQSISKASEEESERAENLMVGEIKNWHSFISSFSPIVACPVASSVITTDYNKAIEFLNISMSTSAINEYYVEKIRASRGKMNVESVDEKIEFPRGQGLCKRSDGTFKIPKKDIKLADEFKKEWSPVNDRAKKSMDSATSLIKENETNNEQGDKHRDISESFVPDSTTAKRNDGEFSLTASSSNTGWKVVREKIATLSRLRELVKAKKALWEHNSKNDLDRFRLVRKEIFRKIFLFKAEEENVPDKTFILVKFSPWTKLCS